MTKVPQLHSKLRSKRPTTKGGKGHGRSSCTCPGKPEEICVRSQGHDLTAITKTWWDSSHYWNVITDGYVLFRKDRPAMPGGGVALYLREQLECIELCLGADEERVES